MNQDRIWNQETIYQTQKTISDALKVMVQNEQYIEGIESCLNQVMPLDQSQLNDMEKVCYIIAAINLIPYSKEAKDKYGNLVIQLEKIAKGLLATNNIKAGKSKLSFLFGQLQQGLASILKNDGDNWGALWEASLGLYLSRGSANPILPFQHLHLAVQAIDRGLPGRVRVILDEMEQALVEPNDSLTVNLLRIKSLRLSGEHNACEALIDQQISVHGESERLKWEKLYTRAIAYDETKDMHRFLFGRSAKKMAYTESYLKYTFWMRAQMKREFNKLCPKVSKLKRMMKGYTSNQKVKRLFKVLSVIEDCHDVEIPFVTRIRSVGKIMPLVETLDAEYKLLATAAIVRWLGQRQRQMASIFHGEYQSLSLKMSEGENPDVYMLFENTADDLELMQPFYDTLHSAPRKESEYRTVDKYLFKPLSR